MDWAEFEHRRVSGFRTVRNRYDKDEVDRFLQDVSEWLETDAVEDLGDHLVQRKLEQVGQATARTLLIAERETEELRRKAEEECAQLKARAEAAADESTARTLEIAEQYASEIRARADADAAQTLADAATEARRVVIEETERQRAEMEAIVAELDRRRNAAVDDVERLRADLLSAIAEHATRIAPPEDDDEGGPAGRRHVPTYGPSKHANA